MKKSVSIKPATQEDFLEIATVHVKSWQESYKGILQQNYLDSLSIEQRFVSRKSYKNIETFVATVDGKIVGFCDVGRIKPEIFTLYVLEDFKRQGIGEELLQCAFESHDFLDAWVFEKNAPARFFYEKQGSLVVDQKKEIIEDSELCEVLYRLPRPFPKDVFLR